MEGLETAFDLIERCHTALADIFPHQGTKAIGGSRIFIGTSVFPVLERCFRGIRDQVQKWGRVETRDQIDTLLAAAEALVTRLEREGRHGNAEQIDEATILLYLANGTMWNYLRVFAVGEPPHNPQYVRVEPMEPLLKRCGRESAKGDVDPKRMVQKLGLELSACLR
jgi:hypothetical protein